MTEAEEAYARIMATPEMQAHVTRHAEMVAGLAAFHGTPLRDPEQVYSHFNQHICGVPTKTTGQPCRQPRRTFHDKSYPCAVHMEESDRIRLDAGYAQRKREDAQRRVEAAKAQRAQEKVAWKTAGQPLRDRLIESTTEAYVSVMQSRIFTLVNAKTGRFATSPRDKRLMVAGAPSNTKLIVVWQGQWASDAFGVTAGELKAVSENS